MTDADVLAAEAAQHRKEMRPPSGWFTGEMMWRRMMEEEKEEESRKQPPLAAPLQV